MENITKNLEEKIGISAIYTLTLALPDRSIQLYEKLVQLQRFKQRIPNELLFRYNQLAGIQTLSFKNLSPIIGRTAIARRFANDTTYTGIVNYAAIGTGTNTPAIGDLTLQTETYRQTFDDTTYINNVAYLSVFIASGTATGTHYEAGLFIDGTATIDTGQLLSRVLFSPPITKTALTSLTLEASLTVG